MHLEQIMKRFPQTIRPTDTLREARDLMVWAGFRHLLVVDDDEQLLGVLTEHDIARYQARIGESIASNPTDTVDRAMTTDVHTAGPQDSVIEGAARLVAEKISCLPIVERGKILGIVTTTDVLKADVDRAMSEPEPQSVEGPTVYDIMTKDPQVAHPEERLFDAAARMQQLRVRHLPVVDADQRVIGILSDRDVRAAIGDPSRLGDNGDFYAATVKVRKAMTAPAVTIAPQQTCRAAARAFADLWVGAVPVVDADEKIIGIVSYVDVLRAFAD